MPLNQQLYTLLCQRFRNVRIGNEDQAMACRYRANLFKDQVDLEIHAWGESYNVDCPFCNDGRQRLSINHRYGVYDRTTDSDNLHLARCFNEDCLKASGTIRELKEKVFGFMNRDQRRHAFRIASGVVPATASSELKVAQLPGEVCPLTDLPEDHPALVYLRERGFNPAELSSVWGVGYCLQATRSYALAQDRLIIPIIMNGICVGWQARHVGERAWKQEKLPKYYTQPSMPKRLVLYNHDLAKHQPQVVICEGPSDVWRVGHAGVAVLGKQATLNQQRLLARLGQTKPLIILLDGDAQGDADRLRYQLKPFVRQGLVQVTLPRQRDPGSIDRAELWSIIQEEAEKQNVPLQANPRQPEPMPVEAVCSVA